MKLLNTVLVSAALLSASAALSAPEIKSLVTLDGVAELSARRVWSSVCVGNLTLDSAVKVEYRYGEAGDFTAVEIPKNTLLLFSQRFTNGTEPYKLTVRFKSPQADDGAEISYDLAETITRLRPRHCEGLENYRFEGERDAGGAIDLVHVE